MKTEKRFHFSGMSRMMSMAFALLISMFALVSCGDKTPTAEDVAKKIDAKEALTNADYTSMIDYCGDYAKKAQPYFDIINGAPNDSTRDAIAAASDLSNLYAEYKYLDMFRDQLDNVDMSTLDKSNREKIEKLVKYESFPLPEGAAGNLEDSAVVGDIVDMPNSDTAGVIATGDGEAVQEEVKR